MKRKEVNVMEGIDFKSSQARMREQIKRAKRERVKETILFYFIALAIVVMAVMLMINNNNEFVSNCTEAGYSESYCIGRA